MNKHAILEHYRDFGYAVIPGALSANEVDYLNALFDKDMAANPQDWSDPSGGATGSGTIILNKYPELDNFVRHPIVFPLIQEILMGEARYAQYDIRDVAPNLADKSGLHFHRDISFYGKAGGWVWDPDNPYKSSYACVIYYLTPVHDCCPCFCMAPNTHEFNTIDEAKEQLGDAYREVPIRGDAGTAILYNITTYHTRMPGQTDCKHGRRTMHNYHSRKSFPVLTDFTTVPEALAMSSDPETRKFYSQWTPAQIVFARDHYTQPVPSYYPVTSFPPKKEM